MRTRFHQFLSVALLGLFTLSCSASKTSGKTEIRYMAWGNPEQLALEESLCELFNRENSDIHVKFLKVPGSSYGNKSVVMLASDTAPDVLRIDHYNFANLQRKRFFLDLSTIAKNDPTFKESDFFPQTIEECKVDGKLFGLNVLFGGTVVYYNKTLMKEAGLEDPYTLWQKGQWTYEKFVEHAKKLSKKDSRGKATQFGTLIPPFPNWVPLVWGFGGEIVDLKSHRSLLTDSKTLAGLQFIADLRYKHGCAPTPAQVANSAFTFESGKLGMYFDWMGMTPRYRKVVKSFDWDVVPIPTGPVNGYTVVKGNQIVVPQNCQHPQAAWRFMRFITGPQIENLLYVKNRRCFPTRIEVANSKEFLDSSSTPHQIHIFLDAVKTGKPLPIDDRWGEWTQAMNNELDFLWNGVELDTKAVANRATTAIDKVLSEEPGW